MVLYSKPHLPCHVQYVGSLKLEKCAVISAANRWELLLSPADGQTAECWLMLGWEEGMWGHRAKSQPQHGSQGELFFLMEMRGGLIGLNLSRQSRNKPPYAELEPKPFLVVHVLRARLLGHHLSCQGRQIIGGMHWPGRNPRREGNIKGKQGMLLARRN